MPITKIATKTSTTKTKKSGKPTNKPRKEVKMMSKMTAMKNKRPLQRKDEAKAQGKDKQERQRLK